MKYILILADGAADEPVAELGNKTPLEAAHKPNMDKIAKLGRCGMMKTVDDSLVPGSDVANMSIMGYDPFQFYTGRGALEALSDAGMTTGINGDIKIISFDACKNALELVDEGVINVDIECNPLQGDYVSSVIKSLEKGELIQKEYIVDEMVFTQEMVSDYLELRTY